MKTETKRCHFVPKTYLEKFYQKVNNKYILVAKSKSEGKIFHPSATNICVRKNLYVLPGTSEEERQLIEKFYAESIETHYNEVYDILTRSKISTISKKQKELIISTILTLLFRNPFILDWFNDFTTRTINRLYDLAENSSSRSFSIDNERINIDKIPREEYLDKNNIKNKEIFNISHIRFAFRLMEIRANDCMAVTEIQDDGEYITSDNPVSFSNKVRTGIFDPTNNLRLPLTTNKCLEVYSTEIKDYSPLKIARRKIKGNLALLDSFYVNRLQHFYSKDLLIGSYKSLKSIEALINKSDEELMTIAQNAKKELELMVNQLSYLKKLYR